MGKSSGSPQIMMVPSQQSSTSTVSLPSWVDAAAQENLALANQVAFSLPGPYKLDRVADMTPDQLAGIDAVVKNLGSTNADFANAKNIAGQSLAGAQPAYQSAFNLANASSNPQSVQNAISGLQSSIGQSYTPVTNSVNYAPISYGDQGYTPINFNSQSYHNIDVNRTPYSNIQVGASPVEESLGMIRGTNETAQNRIAGAIDSIGSSFNPVYNNTNPAMNSLKGTIADARDMQNFAADRVAAQSLTQGNISEYMNPYTDAVVNASLRSLDKARLNSLNANADKAISSRALGGSRQALQDAITNAEFGDRAASLTANLQSQNFSQAQAALQADQARRLQADLANQSAGIQGAGVRQNAANLAMQGANTLGRLGLDTGTFNVNAANTLGNLSLGGAQFQLGAANTMGNLGLTNRGQEIGAQQANANLALQNQQQINAAQQANAALALQNQGLGITAGQANMNAALQQRGQDINAQQANMSAALQAGQLDQQRQLQNAQLGLQQQQQNQNAYNALGGLGLSNAQLGYQGAGFFGNLGNQQATLGLNAAQTLGGLANTGQQSFLQGANSALAASGMLQNQQQNEMNAVKQEYDDWQNSIMQPLNIRLSALGQTPYGQTVTGSASGLQGQMYQPQSSSPLMTALGLGATALGAYFGGPAGASAGSSLMGSLFGGNKSMVTGGLGGREVPTFGAGLLGGG